MKQNNYHHGDLRNALIEAGINIVNKEGMMALTLRKVAASCKVSHNAPYNHFKDKEHLLEAMQNHIIDQFTLKLQEVLDAYDDATERLSALGCAYLRFFMENPHYYNFVFGHMGIHIDFDNWLDKSYSPFDIFKSAAIAELRKQGKQESDYLQSVLAMWSVVHGFTGMATIGTISYSGDWEHLLLQIMHETGCP